VSGRGGGPWAAQAVDRRGASEGARGGAVAARALEARVIVRGVCENEVDIAGRPTLTRLALCDTHSVEVLREGRTNIWEVALDRSRNGDRNRKPSDDRIKLAGTVLFQSAMGRIFLRDEAGALQAWQLVTLPRRGSRGYFVERPPAEQQRHQVLTAGQPGGVDR